MKNPFPGVNPFIEAEGFWEDFHRTMVNYLREAILAELPPRYDARVEERVDLLDPDTGRSIRKPDVAIIDRSSGSGASRPNTAPGSVAVIEVEQLPVEEYREVWIEIRDLADESLVTSIELLSPTNKTSGGFSTFQFKRLQLLEGGANLVDIDLLLAGERLHFRQPLPAGDYYAFTSRTARRPKTEVIAWPIVNELPTIAIPLRTPDPDLLIDLQAVYSTTFERGQYSRRLRYRTAFTHADPKVVEWARSRVPAA